MEAVEVVEVVEEESRMVRRTAAQCPGMFRVALKICLRPLFALFQELSGRVLSKEEVRLAGHLTLFGGPQMLLVVLSASARLA